MSVAETELKVDLINAIGALSKKVIELEAWKLNAELAMKELEEWKDKVDISLNQLESDENDEDSPLLGDDENSYPTESDVAELEVRIAELEKRCPVYNVT